MTWTAPHIERTTDDGEQLNVPSAADERVMLEGWLRWHRETLLTKCAGLTPAQLARTTAQPSGLTLLGLVRHMAEIERWWFRRSFAGEPIGDVFTGPGDGDEGIEGVDAAHAERDFAAYRAETEACEAAVAGRGLGSFVWIMPGSRGLARTLAALSSVAMAPPCLPPPPCDRTHQTPLPDPA
ncbi:DUF664 domain-containing protein [Streptomyces sp. NPDC102437]|uniref:mycothiol transferase n=1 Tax=Streptomyces sp. NPDC102437 TaxID=3366175 RepID=UPI003823B2D0